MKTVYIADDGKEFDDKYKCENYEWQLNHPCLKDIKFYDVDRKELTDLFSEDTYEKVMQIVVPTEKALKDLQELGDYTGFSCYVFINEYGVWLWSLDECKFVKQVKQINDITTEEMDKIINKLFNIVEELDARNCSANCIIPDLTGFGWTEVCELGINLLEQIK